MVPSILLIVNLLLVYINVAQGVLDEIFHKACRGQCGQGEGDCDKDRDCLPGLICDYDWWFNKDYCKAGILKICTKHLDQNVLQLLSFQNSLLVNILIKFRAKY